LDEEKFKVTLRKDVESIKTIKISQSDLRSAMTENGEYELRYRITRDDGVPVSNWTPTFSVSAPTIAQDNSKLRFASILDHDFSMSLVKSYEFPAYDIFLYFVPEINFAQSPFLSTITARPTTTTAIFYTAAPHFLKKDMRISILGAAANYNTVNALVTVANNSSFTITGGLTAVTATNTTATTGVVTVISSNVGVLNLNNSDYYFFDRFYDRPGSTTFFTSFNVNNVYAMKASQHDVRDLIFDPQSSTANLLNGLPSSAVTKYVASNNCMFVLIQPATVPSKTNLKPSIITSPNMILGKKQIP